MWPQADDLPDAALSAGQRLGGIEVPELGEALRAVGDRLHEDLPLELVLGQHLIRVRVRFRVRVRARVRVRVRVISLELVIGQHLIRVRVRDRARVI